MVSVLSRKWRLWAATFCLTLFFAVSLEPVGQFLTDANLAQASFRFDATVMDSDAMLSTRDSELYEKIFAAQKDGDWQLADDLLSQTRNSILLGNVLAQRYLHRDYTSTAAELSQWMNHYSDHAQAVSIASLARKKGVRSTPTPLMSKSRALSGYGESFHNERHKKAGFSSQWKHALNAWKRGDYATAYRHFSDLDERRYKLGEWDRAAISFWSYRAADALGEDREAEAHLENAAQYPRSFYGAQAVEVLGISLSDTVSLKRETSLNKILDNIEKPRIERAFKRISALIATGQIALAKKELKLHYPLANAQGRAGFANLASQLNMPAMQLRMGVDLERKGITAGHALYPLPKWQPKSGYIVDPALVFAIARQESGFNTKARSYAGARGTMQIMPATAKYIAKKFGTKVSRHSDAESNINLGQHYLNYLADKSYIDGNIILLAIAYNAGPAHARNWSKDQAAMNDPLYFIETIPFTETRDYVMNVLTNYWMYREQLEEESAHTAKLVENQWPMAAENPQQISKISLPWLSEPRS